MIHNISIMYISFVPFSTTFFHEVLICFYIPSIRIKDQAQTIHQMNLVSIILCLNRIYYTARMMLGHKRHHILSNLSGRNFSSTTVYQTPVYHNHKILLLLLLDLVINFFKVPVSVKLQLQSVG